MKRSTENLGIRRAITKPGGKPPSWGTFCGVAAILCFIFALVVGFMFIIQKGQESRDRVNQMDWAPVEANRIEEERNVLLRRIAVALELEYMRKYGSFPSTDQEEREAP